MLLGYNSHIWLPLLALLLALILAARVWRFRDKPIARTFLILMSALAWWSVSVVMEYANVDLSGKILWMKMSYLGITIVPVVWLAFTLQYTDRENWLTRRNVAILSILPITTLVMVWTNDLHHLMWTKIWLDTSVSPPEDAVTHGAWFWVHATYSYSLLIIATICLLIFSLRASRIYRKQVATMLLAVLIPWLANFAYITGVGPFSVIDPTPLAFAITGIALFWGLTRFQLLDITPVAHEAIFRNMVDGVIVLDGQQRITDLNPAAQNIIRRTRSDVIGQPYNVVLPGQMSLSELRPDMSEARAVMTRGKAQGSSP